MFKKITSAPKRIKNHVVQHRAKYATVATAAVCYKGHRAVVDRFNIFLEEHDLLDEYYSLND